MDLNENLMHYAEQIYVCVHALTPNYTTDFEKS